MEKACQEGFTLIMDDFGRQHESQALWINDHSEQTTSDYSKGNKLLKRSRKPSVLPGPFFDSINVMISAGAVPPVTGKHLYRHFIMKQIVPSLNIQQGMEIKHLLESEHHLGFNFICP